MVLSIAVPLVTIATPVFATTATAPSSPVSVVQGGTFVLHGSVTFDKPALGDLVYIIYWYDSGLQSENFVVDNINVRWNDDNSYVDNMVIAQYAITGGWQVDVEDAGMYAGNSIARNGTINIDITLEAKGSNGTLHAADNENIYFPADSITFFEPSPGSVGAGPIEIDVYAAPRGVNVSVSPSQSGWTGDTLSDTVVVTNTGSLAENYHLTLGESAAWPIGWNAPSQVLDPTVVLDNIHVPAGYSPENKAPGTPTQIGVLDDASTRQNLTTNNNGRSYNMYVANLVGGRQNTFIKFDLSSIPAGATVTNATLFLDSGYGPETTTYGVESAAVELWSVTDDSWKEGNFVADNNGYAKTPGDNIRWDNQPAMVTMLDNELLPAPASTKDNLWYTWSGSALTTFIATQRAGDSIASLGLWASTSAVDDNMSMWFYTKDNYFEYSVPPMTASGHNGDFRPRLEVTYTDTPIENTISLGPGASWTGTITKIVSGSPGNTDTITVTATTWDSAVTGSGNDVITNNVAGVNVTILPPKNLLKTPGVWSWTVRVTNTGGLPDTFTLSEIGTQAGWTKSLAGSIGPIPAGGYMDTTLTDNMPITAVVGDVDTITVTATSVHIPYPTSSDIATLTTKVGENRGVDITITPDNQTAHASIVDTLINPSISYDPLTYMVSVTNTGLLDDLYRFDVTDTLGWGLKIDPAEIFIPGNVNETEYVSLSVTVPNDAVGGTYDNIFVTVTGKMATGRGPDNENKSAEYMIIATVPVVQGVQIEVLPDNLEPQTGAPGSMITWLVVVKNTGNDDEHFNVTLTSARGWSLTADNLNIPISAGKKWTTMITENIPDNARTSMWDNIHVVVTKVENPAVTDDTTVRLHVREPGPQIPEGVIEIAVDAKIVAIDVNPLQWYVGIMDEAATQTSDNFNVRNTGNVAEDIYAKGTDAQSMPGEPVTTWALLSAIGIDEYTLSMSGVGLLSTSDILAFSSVGSGSEVNFNLTLDSPSVITTPARMWARVVLTAVAA